MASFQSSVHYLKKFDQVLHISTVTPFEKENDVRTGQFNISYTGSQKICFEFFNPKDMTLIENEVLRFDTQKGVSKRKMLPTHVPIMIEKEDYELAYVCEDVHNDKNHSFLVLLTRFNGEKRFPKLLKFTKTAKGYWKIP